MVIGRHVVALTAFSVQPDPSAPPWIHPLPKPSTLGSSASGAPSVAAKWPGYLTRFKHVLKLSAALCSEAVAEQFSRVRTDRQQQTAKNCGNETGEISSGCDLSGQIEFEGDFAVHVGELSAEFATRRK